MRRSLGSIAAALAPLAAILCGELQASASAAEPGAPRDEAGESVHLSYDAPAGCPDEAEFLETIAGDGGRLIRASEGEPGRSFVVTVQDEGAVTGRLVVRAIDGTEATRSITGNRCEDVVRALAVLVTLSLKEPLGSVSSPADATASNLPSNSAAPLARSVTAPAVAVSNHSHRRAPVEAATEPVESLPDAIVGGAPRWRLSLEIDGTFEAGASPGLAPGIAGYLEVAKQTSALFAPSFRLGGELGSVWTIKALENSSDPESFVGSATIQKKVARFDGCPIQWLAAERWESDYFSLQPCLRLDAGRLDVKTANGLIQGHQYDDLHIWTALTALLRLRWVLQDVFFEAETGVVFPLIRDRVTVETTETPSRSVDLFDIPVAAGTLAFGIGGFFW